MTCIIGVIGNNNTETPSMIGNSETYSGYITNWICGCEQFNDIHIVGLDLQLESSYNKSPTAAHAQFLDLIEHGQDDSKEEGYKIILKEDWYTSDKQKYKFEERLRLLHRDHRAIQWKSVYLGLSLNVMDYERSTRS